jgi:hypothetical protein
LYISALFIDVLLDRPELELPPSQREAAAPSPTAAVQASPVATQVAAIPTPQVATPPPMVAAVASSIPTVVIGDVPIPAKTSTRVSVTSSTPSKVVAGGRGSVSGNCDHFVPHAWKYNKCRVCDRAEKDHATSAGLDPDVLEEHPELAVPPSKRAAATDAKKAADAPAAAATTPAPVVASKRGSVTVPPPPPAKVVTPITPTPPSQPPPATSTTTATTATTANTSSASTSSDVPPAKNRNGGRIGLTVNTNVDRSSDNAGHDNNTKALGEKRNSVPSGSNDDLPFGGASGAASPNSMTRLASGSLVPSTPRTLSAIARGPPSPTLLPPPPQTPPPATASSPVTVRNGSGHSSPSPTSMATSAATTTTTTPSTILAIISSTSATGSVSSSLLTPTPPSQPPVTSTSGSSQGNDTTSVGSTTSTNGPSRSGSGIAAAKRALFVGTNAASSNTTPAGPTPASPGSVAAAAKKLASSGTATTTPPPPLSRDQSMRQRGSGSVAALAAAALAGSTSTTASPAKQSLTPAPPRQPPPLTGTAATHTKQPSLTPMPPTSEPPPVTNTPSTPTTPAKQPRPPPVLAGSKVAKAAVAKSIPPNSNTSSSAEVSPPTPKTPSTPASGDDAPSPSQRPMNTKKDDDDWDADEQAVASPRSASAAFLKNQGNIGKMFAAMTGSPPAAAPVAVEEEKPKAPAPRSAAFLARQSTISNLFGSAPAKGTAVPIVTPSTKKSSIINSISPTSTSPIEPSSPSSAPDPFADLGIPEMPMSLAEQAAAAKKKKEDEEAAEKKKKDDEIAATRAILNAPVKQSVVLPPPKKLVAPAALLAAFGGPRSSAIQVTTPSPPPTTTQSIPSSPTPPPASTVPPSTPTATVASLGSLEAMLGSSFEDSPPQPARRNTPAAATITPTVATPPAATVVSVTPATGISAAPSSSASDVSATSTATTVDEPVGGSLPPPRTGAAAAAAAKKPSPRAQAFLANTSHTALVREAKRPAGASTPTSNMVARTDLADSIKMSVSVTCKKLAQLDWMSVTSPIVAIFQEPSAQAAASGVPPVMLDRTEWLRDTLDPVFTKILSMDYKPLAKNAKSLRLLICVYDVATDGIDSKCLLGTASIGMEELVGQAGVVTLPLENKNEPSVDEGLRDAGSVVTLNVSGNDSLFVDGKKPIIAAANESKTVIGTTNTAVTAGAGSAGESKLSASPMVSPTITTLGSSLDERKIARVEFSVSCRNLPSDGGEISPLVAMFLKEPLSAQLNFIGHTTPLTLSSSHDRYNPVFDNRISIDNVEDRRSHDFKCSVYDCNTKQLSDRHRIGSSTISLQEMLSKPIGQAVEYKLEHSTNGQRLAKAGSRLVITITKLITLRQAETEQPVILTPLSLRTCHLISIGEDFNTYNDFGELQRMSIFYRRTTEEPMGTLYWCDHGLRQEIESQSIRLTDITDVYLGRHQSGLQKNAALSIAEDHCFTLATTKRAINVECTNIKQRDAWALGIVNVLEVHRKRGVRIHHADPVKSVRLSITNDQLLGSPYRDIDEHIRQRLESLLHAGDGFLCHTVGALPMPRLLVCTRGAMASNGEDASLQCYDAGILADKERLPLADITDIFLGKTHVAFGQAQRVDPSLCMTILAGEASLHIEADDPVTRTNWAAGLCLLARHANGGRREITVHAQPILSVAQQAAVASSLAAMGLANLTQASERRTSRFVQQAVLATPIIATSSSYVNSNGSSISGPSGQNSQLSISLSSNSLAPPPGSISTLRRNSSKGDPMSQARVDERKRITLKMPTGQEVPLETVLANMQSMMETGAAFTQSVTFA